MERRILTGIITSTPYCVAFFKMYNKSYIKSKICKKIISWVRDYFDRHEIAPMEDIQRIFESKMDGTDNDSEKEFIEDLLYNLSKEFDKTTYNHSYHIDETVLHFKKIALENLSDDILTMIETKDVEGAENEVVNFKLPKNEKSDGFYILEDMDALKSAFEEDMKPLFDIPGVLGKYMGSEFTRDTFIAFLAPEKRGKSWFLQQIAIWALESKCNVALFNVGDMSKSQVIRRYATTACDNHYNPRFCEPHLYPVMDCLLNQNNTCEKEERTCDFGIFDGEDVKQIRARPYEDIISEIPDSEDYIPCSECKMHKDFKGTAWYVESEQKKPLTVNTIARDFGIYAEYWGKFKVSVHPTDSINVKGIKNLLEQWEVEEEFVPDVIIVDYIDIMAKEDNKSVGRDIVNGTWKALRSLSLEKHICLVGATQADAAAQDAHTLGTSNFSEDKRKSGHVTAFYGINRTPEEEKRKILRINSLLIREDARSSKQISILQDLNRGQVYTGSF